jgi:16S rRNA (guanine527-N7)-methyltransferase
VEEASRDLLVEGASRMGVALADEAVSRFGILLALLQTWGSRINLTTRLGEREIVVHHFLDSLVGAGALARAPSARVIDLGAGAGFPSFPLKFALPGLRVTLAESIRKKVAFCREVIRATGCADMEALCARAEDLAHRETHRRAHDWAVSRALGSAADVLRLAVPLLAPGGRLMIYKGAPDRNELDDLARACGAIGAAWSLGEVEVPFLEARRSLILVTLA